MILLFGLGVVLGTHISDCGRYFLWSPKWQMHNTREQRTFFTVTCRNSSAMVADGLEFDIVMYAKEGAWSEYSRLHEVHKMDML
jgi:hypothetical protein